MKDPPAKEPKGTPKTLLRKDDVGFLGDLSISITRVEVAEVSVLSLGRQRRTDQPYLQIGLRLQNRSSTAKITYLGWGEDIPSLVDYRAHLEDDLGNHYAPIHAALGDRFIGQATDSSLYPGKETDDLLIFEVPVEKASRLTLTLPGNAVSAKGDLRYLIIQDHR